MFQNALLTIKVSDLKRAVAFYSETLGLERGPQYGEHWAEIVAPGVKIGLHPGGTPHDDTTRHLSVGLRVANLEKAMTTLESRGVKFWGTRADGGSRQAYFTDPDGNPLYLIEVEGY